ncbi:hypothetical protein Leucomu_13445 [Leucobacter muris]|uniref:DUF4342 domain-containing protein n=1 Tax=Leucobacter muris TaxID=1935379 RepID=A0ABX5QIL5_9MICO|nr:hypothetical protein [Leucobacter muris]QAB18780.1 hypothetical protein Leucomu_13445 [Leucobacter muris]
MNAPIGAVRPSNSKLAKIFDEAIQNGLEIRYSSEQQVVVYRKNQWGCGGLILLVILGILTAFIVPIILLVLGALSPGGQVTTYTLMPNGKIKKKQRAARN